MELHFKLERETKNTYRFQELNDQGEVATVEEYMVGTLYVQKAFFDGKKPDAIKVIIEAEVLG